MPPLNSLYSVLLNWLLKEQPARDECLSDFVRISQTLKPGDVLLVDGRRRLDRRLKAISTSRWSQSVLYLGRLHDIADPTLRAMLCDHYPCEADTQLTISTSLERGLVLLPLNSLESEHLRICRPSGLDQNEITETLRYAISRLGVNRGSAWGAVLWMLFPWGLIPHRWRARVFSRMAGRRLRYYTGNMIGEAFAFVRFPVFPLVKPGNENGNRLYRRHPRSHFAADFDHSPYFEIVKYPFVEQALHATGDMIPWQANEQTGNSSNHSSLHLIQSQADSRQD